MRYTTDEKRYLAVGRVNGQYREAYFPTFEAMVVETATWGYQDKPGLMYNLFELVGWF